MIDLTYFRNNLDELRISLARKKFDCDLDYAASLDEERRSAISNAEQARALQNSSNLEMSKLPKGSPEFLKKVGEMKILAENVKKLETLAKDADAKFQEVFLSIPNMPHESVPDGKGEDENQVISTWGSPEDSSPHAVPHYEIPWFDEMIDFLGASRSPEQDIPFIWVICLSLYGH